MGVLLLAVVIIVFVVPLYRGQEPLGPVVLFEGTQELASSGAGDGQEVRAPELSLVTALDAAAAQPPASEGAAEDDSISPVVLPPDAALVSTQQNEWGRGWTYRWVGVATTAAQDILHGFDDGRWELVHASTLDLFGEAWGCVVREKGGSHTVMVHIVPTSISAYSTECSELLISVAEMGVDR